MTIEEDFKQTIEKVKDQYRRRYAVTLSPTIRNITRAIEIYKNAVENHWTLYRAIINTYGYRYRRMENFMKELGLWLPKQGWLHPKILTKLYFVYAGRTKFTAEFFLRHYIPEHLIGNHDIKKCHQLTRDLVEACRWYWTLKVGKPKVGDDVKIDWGYTYCCTQKLNVNCVLWKDERIYDKTTKTVELANYVLHKIKVCGDVRDWEIS